MKPGTLLHNRYRIRGPLGQGGMGAVFLADDTRLAGRRVAIKENLTTSLDAQEQFQREAVILARLRHPNLPTVIDFFIEPSGQQYLVMEYVEGVDLQKYLAKRGAMPEEEALRCSRQLLSALHYMHTWRDPDTGRTRPVIHRDIKPANVKLTPDGRFVLVDFGIAKLATGTATVASARALTPGYAPLEQYHGGTDERSDIYAFGATLYALLSGQTPPSATGMATGEPLPLFRDYSIRASKAVEAAVRKAMATQPDDRYQSVDSLHQALFGTSLSRGRKTTGPPLEMALPGKAAPRPTAFPRGRLGLFTAAGLFAAVLAFAWLLWPRGGMPEGVNPAADDATAPALALEVPATATPSATSPPSPTPSPTATPGAVVEAAGEEGSALLEMATFTPTAGPTASPTATTAATRTRAPTSTPLPTSTPVARPTVRSTPVAQATATSRPRATTTQPAAPTQAVAPPAAANSGGGPQSVRILEPIDGRSTTGRVEFRWQPDVALEPGQVYELAFWLQGGPEKGRALDNATTATSRSLRLDSMPPGVYTWGIWLAVTEPSYRRVRYLGPDYTIIVETEFVCPDDGDGDDDYDDAPWCP